MDLAGGESPGRKENPVTEFIDSLAWWEWVVIVVASWTILAILIAPRVGRELKARFSEEDEKD